MREKRPEKIFSIAVETSATGSKMLRCVPFSKYAVLCICCGLIFL